MDSLKGGDVLYIKSDIQQCLSMFFENLDECGIDVNDINITIEYNDGFNYIKLEDDDIEL